MGGKKHVGESNKTIIGVNKTIGESNKTVLNFILNELNCLKKNMSNLKFIKFDLLYCPALSEHTYLRNSQTMNITCMNDVHILFS